MFQQNVMNLGDLDGKSSFEREVFFAENRRLLKATALAHADVVQLRRQIEVLVAENQRLQALWSATHPANQARTPVLSFGLNLQPTTDDLMRFAHEKWEKLSADNQALQEELWESRVRASDLASALALEKCCCVQLRCEASLAADRHAELDCHLVRVLDAKKTSELELLHLTSECEALHKWSREGRPTIADGNGAQRRAGTHSTFCRQSTAMGRQSTYRSTATMGRQSTYKSTLSRQSSRRFSWFWTSSSNPD